MSRTYSLRFGAGALVFALAVASWSSEIKPFKVITSKPGRVINTKSFFPQINPTLGHGIAKIRSENPRFVVPKGEPNSLPFGLQNNDLIRGKRKAKFAGIGFTGYVPPDCDMAVGPTSIVQVVNTDIAFYTKAGTEVFHTSFDEFFADEIGTLGGIITDPKVAYDKSTGRFYTLILHINFATKLSHILFAVSDDSDPAGNWTKYVFNSRTSFGGDDYWTDYPGFGFNALGMSITSNFFNFALNRSGGSYMAVFDKAPALSGAAITLNVFRFPNMFTIQVARSNDLVDPYIYCAAVKNGSTLDILAIKDLPAAPVVETTTLAVPTFKEPPFAADSPVGRFLDQLDSRLLNLYWRDGSMVAAHDVDPGSGPSNGFTVARWYEIKTNGWPGSAVVPTLNQSGQINGAQGQYLFMPAVNINAAGDIAMVYSRSSKSIVADLLFAGRTKSDQPGVMSRASVVARSVGPVYSPFAGFHRWGDYFCVAVDPKDDLTFWVNGMIGGDPSIEFWRTVIAKYTISSSTGGGADKIRPGGIKETQGGTTSGGLASVLASDNAYYSINSSLVSRLGHVAGYETNYTVSTSPGELNLLTLHMEAVAASNVTCSVFLYDWGQAKYVYVGAFPLSGTEASKDFKMTASSWATYINPAKQLKMVTRALMPNSLYRTAFPFTFKTDDIYLVAN